MRQSSALVVVLSCLALPQLVLAQQPTPAGSFAPGPTTVSPTPAPGALQANGVRFQLTPVPPTVVPAAAVPRLANAVVFPMSPVMPPNVASLTSTPIKVELLDGVKLVGDLQAATALSVVTAFGPAEIPLEVIRGIAWGDTEDRLATLILANDDSLTVKVQAPSVQVKTQWGLANVELSHVRAMILGAERYQWKDGQGGRRVLVPAGEVDNDAEAKR